MNPPPESARFLTTRWSLVRRAGARDATSQRALDDLCRQYWYPLYAFLRRRGTDSEEARDLVQGFFCRLIEKEELASVVPESARGRFRSFLMKGLHHFTTNEWDRARALKRGGGQVSFSLEGGEAESRYRFEPADLTAPEHLFLRRWALTLIDATVLRLEAEFAARGRGEVFQALRSCLDGGTPEAPYAETARKLAMTEGAVKVAVHRMRTRFREIFREEVAHTLEDPADVDDEITALMRAL